MATSNPQAATLVADITAVFGRALQFLASKNAAIALKDAELDRQIRALIDVNAELDNLKGDASRHNEAIAAKDADIATKDEVIKHQNDLISMFTGNDVLVIDGSDKTKIQAAIQTLDDAIKGAPAA